VLASIPAVILLLRRRRRAFAAVLFSLLAVGILILLFLAAALPSTTARYEVDFAPFFVLAGLTGWFVLMAGRAKRVIAALGTLLIVYGCLFGVAISMYGYYDGLRTSHPATYWSLARLTSPLPTAVAMIAGHPVITRSFVVGGITEGNSGTYDLEDASFGLTTAPVEVDVISPHDGRWALAPTFARTPAAGSLPVRISVRYDDSDETSWVDVGTQPVGIPLTLHRGLNRIQLSASTTPVDVENQEPVVSVMGLRLTDP
jgi:hypothetical protein